MISAHFPPLAVVALLTQISVVEHAEVSRNELAYTVHDSRVYEGLSIGGWAVKELSGLAWDEDEQVLYAVSDKGRIVHFKIDVEGNRLNSLQPVFMARLSDPSGVKLPRLLANAEGLDVLNGRNGRKGDSELLVAMEGKPGISRFTPDGRLLASHPLPEPLSNGLKSRKNGLESIAMHPRLGVIVAPEEPVTKSMKERHTLYASDRTFTFPSLGGNGNIKAMDVLESGQVLVLERMRLRDVGGFHSQPRVLDVAECSKLGDLCPSADVHPSGEPVPNANFEGMTRLSNDLYLLVSDDRTGDARSTRFVLLSLKRAGDPPLYRPSFH